MLTDVLTLDKYSLEVNRTTHFHNNDNADASGPCAYTEYVCEGQYQKLRNFFITELCSREVVNASAN